MKKITVTGTGGHAAAVCHTILQGGTYEIEGLLSETLPVGEKSCGFPIIGSPHSKDWLHLWSFVAIGDNVLREKFSQLGFQFINVIHPTAQVSTVMCRGTYFGANSFVGHNAAIGNFCIINSGSIVEHDCSVGDFTHIAPGAVIGGRVKIGSRTFIGLNATIRDGVTIGNNCIVGAGSNVTKHVLDNSVVYGNPATLQRENK